MEGKSCVAYSVGALSLHFCTSRAAFKLSRQKACMEVTGYPPAGLLCHKLQNLETAPPEEFLLLLSPALKLGFGISLRFLVIRAVGTLVLIYSKPPGS